MTDTPRHSQSFEERQRAYARKLEPWMFGVAIVLPAAILLAIHEIASAAIAFVWTSLTAGFVLLHRRRRG